VKPHQTPADARPFRCRADLERDRTLDDHYRKLGIRCVVAAVSQKEPKVERPNVPRAHDLDE